MEVGPILDATVALGGVAIAALRVSFADPASAHVGLSHHTATALRLACRERDRDPRARRSGARTRRASGPIWPWPASTSATRSSRCHLRTCSGSSTGTAWTSPRWGDRRPTTRCCSRPRRRPGRSPSSDSSPIGDEPGRATRRERGDRPARAAAQPDRHAARHPSSADPRRARRSPRTVVPRREGRTPPCLRTRQGDAARARDPDQRRDGRRARRRSRRTASTPTTTTCPTSGSPTAERAALHVAVDRGAARGQRRAGRAAQARRHRGRGGAAGRTARGHARARRLLRRGREAAHARVLVPRRAAHARALRRRAPLRPLVRGRAAIAAATRPASFRVDRIEGAPVAGGPAIVRAAGRRRSRRVPARRPAHATATRLRSTRSVLVDATRAAWVVDDAG